MTNHSQTFIDFSSAVLLDTDLLHRLIGYFVDIICCRFKLGADQSEVSH